MSFSQPQDQDYQHLEQLWGDEIYQLSPSVKQIIAGALRKVRERDTWSCYKLAINISPRFSQEDQLS